jgi:hypothetical protein
MKLFTRSLMTGMEVIALRYGKAVEALGYETGTLKAEKPARTGGA